MGPRSVRWWGSQADRFDVPRRIPLVLVTLVAAAVLAASAGAGTVESMRTLEASASLESGVLAAMNAVRAKHGLPRLRASTELQAAADAHSRAMAQRGFFAHESSDGAPFWKRVQRFYGQAGFGRWSVGENLLWASPDLDAAKALELWMASAGHRENILAPGWREVGVAAVRAPSAPGTFRGLEVTIVTADFGTRR